MHVTINDVNYGVKWWGGSPFDHRSWWFHRWTPAWHQGRGPYISIGLGMFAIYRGY